IVRLMLPVSMLFACLFTTGKMSNLNEITAMKAGGMSMYRFMMPILIVSFLLCIGAIFFGGYVVPYATKTKLKIEANDLKRGGQLYGSNLFFQDSPSRIVCMGYFSDENNLATRVSIQDFDKKDVTKLLYRLDASTMTYDSLTGKWTAFDVTERKFNQFSEEITILHKKEITKVNFKPKELLIKQQKSEEMNLTELRAAIVTRKTSGNDPTRLEIEYYSRFSFAMAGIIVVIFGLPFSTDKRRGGVAVQVGVNILITFIYLVLLKVVEAFGKNGSLNPILTAWMVNFIFLGAALVNLKRVKQ
ncbi:MAG: LptF/LptG family permease, partial [Ignavibacteriales bacterium]|nr:LptF/LptG family permease [Ignavibacteriales bacterium]